MHSCRRAAGLYKSHFVKPKPLGYTVLTAVNDPPLAFN